MKLIIILSAIILVVASGWYLLMPRGCVIYKVDRATPDFQSIGSILRSYKITAGQYPTTQQGLRALVERPEAAPLPKGWVQFCEAIPRDSWQNEYQYRLLPEGSKATFELWTFGADGLPGTGDEQSSLGDGNDLMTVHADSSP